MSPMKKLLSVLCALTLIVGILAVGVVSASADVPTTAVDVKAGDKVSYELSLSDVPEKIVGCDFSVYYDPSVFTIDSAADFTGSTNDEDWQATLNPDNKGTGEVLCNWSILKGVSFSNKRSLITLNMTAKEDANAHISYFVRYMYDDSVFDSPDKPQVDQYVFSCDVTKNGEAVVTAAQPELNVEEEQPNGLFANSRTGNSNDANTALSGNSIYENGGAADGLSNDNGNNGNSANGNNSNNGSNSGNASNNNNNKSNGSKNSATTADGKSDGAVNSPNEKSNTKDNNTVQTDASGKIVEKSDETVASTSNAKNGGSNTLMWVIIAAIVVIAGGSIAAVVIKGKKGAAPADKVEEAAEEAPKDTDKTE